MKIGKALALVALTCFAAYFVERLALFDLPGQRGDYMAVGFLVLVLAYWSRAGEAKVV